MVLAHSYTPACTHMDIRSLTLFRKVLTLNRDISEATGWSNRPSSPSSTTKVHHGHTGALPFRRSQKNFLCIKSPPSMSLWSSKSPGKLLTMTDDRTSATTSTVSSPQSMCTMGQPSLKLRESTTSVGSPGLSSGGLMNGDACAASDADVVETVWIPHGHARLLTHALTPMCQALAHSHLGKTIGESLTVLFPNM